jgi:transcriptional regulator with XRE-family HTH domain
LLVSKSYERLSCARKQVRYIDCVRATLRPAASRPPARARRTVLRVSNRRQLPPSSEFGAYLLGLLDAKGYTRATLSRAAEVPESSISRWITGDSKPTLELLRKIAPHVGVRLGDLLIRAGLATAAELGMVGAPPAPTPPMPEPLRRIMEIVKDERISDRDTDILLDSVDQAVTMWLRTFRGLHATTSRRGATS